MKKHQQVVLAFALHEVIPFTNNQEERDIRPAKTKQKISGSFRPSEGAKVYVRILGFISTTRKHQLSIFNELKSTFQEDNFITRNAPPK